ncbi:MAG TPA: hypothetical protein EYG51_24000 [Pseudomonadales bacterium]|nr:hypothetical protein [Pseudomonadales bacterium]
MSAYVSPNAKSGAELKRWLKAGVEVEVFNPGMGTVPFNGTVYLEGPHYPAPHKWWLEGTMKDGKLVKVK